MRKPHTLKNFLLAALALAAAAVTTLAADPGLPYLPDSEISDQKAGSILIYNFYISGATSGNVQNTRINITNTSTSSGVAVHVFFVSDGCSIADSFICLTAAQTATFLASDVDPGVAGYIVAVATNANGCPIDFNFLIGDEYIKGALNSPLSFSAPITDKPGEEKSAPTAASPAGDANLTAVATCSGGRSSLRPDCGAESVTATLTFDGSNMGYNRLPRVLALDHISSRVDGNRTLLIVNRIGGNLATGAATLGTIFGILYNDAESAVSFSLPAGGCQLRTELSNSSPRTAPRFEQFIPAGRSGWFKIWSQSDIGILGAAINDNPNAAAVSNAFNGGHNLHVLTLTAAVTLMIPVFPPNC